MPPGSVRKPVAAFVELGTQRRSRLVSHRNPGTLPGYESLPAIQAVLASPASIAVIKVFRVKSLRDVIYSSLPLH
jgi:hypothetical protein